MSLAKYAICLWICFAARNAIALERPICKKRVSQLGAFLQFDPRLAQINIPGPWSNPPQPLPRICGPVCLLNYVQKILPKTDPLLALDLLFQNVIPSMKIPPEMSSNLGREVSTDLIVREGTKIWEIAPMLTGLASLLDFKVSVESRGSRVSTLGGVNNIRHEDLAYGYGEKRGVFAVVHVWILDPKLSKRELRIQKDEIIREARLDPGTADFRHSFLIDRLHRTPANSSQIWVRDPEWEEMQNFLIASRTPRNYGFSTFELISPRAPHVLRLISSIIKMEADQVQ